MYLCCHRVTNRPIGNNSAHHPSLTGLCGFVLDCRCVKNGKKGEVEARSNFTPPQPVSYLHDTQLQLRSCCFVVAACWGWRRCWWEEEEKRKEVSLDLLYNSILQKHLILWEFDLWYRQQKSAVEQSHLCGYVQCLKPFLVAVAIVAWRTNKTIHLSKKHVHLKGKTHLLLNLLSH